MQIGALTNGTAEVVGAYALPFSCRLYVRLMWRAFISQDNGQARHTLPANDADFDPDTIKPHGHDHSRDFVILNGLKYSVVRTPRRRGKKKSATTTMTKGQKS